MFSPFHGVMTEFDCEIWTVVLLEIALLWDMTPCGVVYRCVPYLGLL